MGQPSNTLYYGDNLDILRRYVDDESVDLSMMALRLIELRRVPDPTGCSRRARWRCAD
jgi:hypothetical protein